LGGASPDFVPAYVASCGTWTLALVGSAGARTLVRFRCGSWRCARCGPKYDARLAHRIASGVELHGGAEEYVYVVLTVARDTPAGRRLVAEHGGSTYRTKREAHNRFRPNFARLRKRLARLFGIRLDYVWTREEHADGFPHWNVLFRLPALADFLRAGDRASWQAAQELLRSSIVGSGFGARFWIEAARSGDKLSSYLVKRTHGEQLTAEFAKRSQLPVAGPKGSRRWGCSRGFVPAVEVASEYVGGSLVRMPIEQAEQLDAEGLLEPVWTAAGAYDGAQPLGLRRAAACHVEQAKRQRRSALAQGTYPREESSREHSGVTERSEGRDGCDGGREQHAKHLPDYLLSGPPALRPKGAGGTVSDAPKKGVCNAPKGRAREGFEPCAPAPCHSEEQRAAIGRRSEAPSRGARKRWEETKRAVPCGP